MSQGHWPGGVEGTEILQALCELREGAGSAYEKDFEIELRALMGRIEEWERAYKADFKEAKEAVASVARKLDGKLLELALAATDIQERVEQREEEKLRLERQRVRLEKVKLVLAVVMAFVTGLLVPYVAGLLGLP